MNRINNIVMKILPIVLIILFGFPAMAQEWENEGELEDLEIEIIKERQISLPKANRNFEKIPPRPTDPIRSTFQYDFRSFTFQTTPISPTIRPLKLKQADPTKIYTGYVSAGFGNFASPYLEGYINSGRDKNKLIGAYGLFSASDNGPVDGRNSGSGLSLMSVYGKTFNQHVALSGDLGFENRTTHFYGYPTGTDIEAKDIKQSYSTFRLKGELSNATNSDFGYTLAPSLSYMTDKFDAKESEVDVVFKARYKVSDENAIGVDAGYYLINRDDKLVSADPRSLFVVNPYYEFYPVANLKIHAGLNAAIENDSIGDKNVHAYPDICTSYPLSPSVQAVASLTGGMEKVSLQSLSNENIWLAPNVAIFHTNKLYDFSVGLNTKIANKVSLNGGFSIASLKNWYFFVNDPDDASKFIVEYDREETTRTNFFATIGYAQTQKINISLRADIFSYDRKEEDLEAWHRPTHKITADGSFNIVEKMIMSLRVISLGGMKAENNDGELITLDAALDLSARLEYLLSDNFSAFAQLNNIASNEYPLYLNYPARGFQVMGGLTWKF